MTARQSRRTTRRELGVVNRTVAALLAAVWLTAGVATLVFGVHGRRWIMLLLGPLALAYGLLWVRVAQTGRRLQWPSRRR